MSWNWLDLLIIALALLQIGLCIAICVVALRIKNGPVARLSAVLEKNARSGKRLAETGLDVGQKSLPHLLGTRVALQELAPLFQPITFEDATITYASLARYWGMYSGVRGGIQQVRGLFKDKTKVGATATGKRPSVAHTSMADRLGLVPPAWKRVQPYLRHLPTIRRIISAVRDQMP